MSVSGTEDETKAQEEEQAESISYITDDEIHDDKALSEGAEKEKSAELQDKDQPSEEGRSELENVPYDEDFDVDDLMNRAHGHEYEGEEEELGSNKSEFKLSFDDNLKSEESLGGAISYIDEDKLVLLQDESQKSQAGSWGSLESMKSSFLTEASGLGMPPKNFQEYVQKYSDLFSKKKGGEDEMCDKEAGRAFLKIDLQELISGYRSEDKTAKDSKMAISGLIRIRQDIVQIENEPIILRRDYREYQGVKILSGGLMGYEPLYIDYVGKGMLTGVVLGTTSDPPSVASVTNAMRELINSKAGLLIVIQNNVEYRLIFGLAMERIRMEGHMNVDMVVVGDDCYERCKSPVGRRGLAGIVLIYKLAGSMADCNKTLREIYIATRTASRSLVTISSMLKPFKAIGTGLDKHSKDGIVFNGDSCQMIKKMMDYCLHPMRYFSMRLDPEDSLIVLINSYRSKSPEFYTLVSYVLKELEKRNIKIERVYADNFVSGFWLGFSISLMIDCNNYRAKFLDAPTTVSLWPRNPSNGTQVTVSFSLAKRRKFQEMGPILSNSEAGVVKNAIITACKAILLCEHVLNAMHFFGNYGTKLKVGAEAILLATKERRFNYFRPFNILIEISEVLIEKLPGVIGAMYGCLFEGAARSFLRCPLTTVTAQNWSESMDEALKTLRAYTNAKGGIVSLALSLIPVVMAIHGTYINLPQEPNVNPVLSALESLRHEIEDRMTQSLNEKESLFKNQLDVESYALIIWLHAIYSSVYWKPSEESLPDADMEESNNKINLKSEYMKNVEGKNGKKDKQKVQSGRASIASFEIDVSKNINRINESLDFLNTSTDRIDKASLLSGSHKKSSVEFGSRRSSIKSISKKSQSSELMDDQNIIHT